MGLRVQGRVSGFPQDAFSRTEGMVGVGAGGSERL